MSTGKSPHLSELHDFIKNSKALSFIQYTTIGELSCQQPLLLLLLIISPQCKVEITLSFLPASGVVVRINEVMDVKVM